METLVPSFSPPLLSPPNLSNLNFAFFNPGGLLGGDQEGKISKKAVQLGRVLRAMTRVRSREVDILCITESHITDGNVQDVPQKFLGYSWVHNTTSEDDKFAGVSIGYRWWMPKPVDLLLEVWGNFTTWQKEGMKLPYAYSNLNLIKGRLQIVVFQLEEIDVIICNFYGSPSSDERHRHTLITLAKHLISDRVNAWIKLTPKNRKISVLWGGDFNASSHEMWPIASSKYKTGAPAMCNGCMLTHKPQTICSTTAMTGIEKLFKHVNTIAPCVDGSGKYVTYEHSNRWCGIDHIYLMSQPDLNSPIGTLHVPKIRFWHEKLDQSNSGHHILTIALLDVWTCAINRRAKGAKAPFKRLPDWLFKDPVFMESIKYKAQQVYEEMSVPNSHVCSIWDKFYKAIPGLASYFISSIKKRLIHRKNGICNMNSMDKAKLENEIEAEWEVIDPDPQNKHDGFNDSGIAGSRKDATTVYTTPLSIRHHIHELFSQKFQPRRDHSRVRMRQRKEWMKYAPPKLTVEDTESLEDSITWQNIKKAIENMRKDAAPGIDGISLLLFSHELTIEIFAKILTLVANDAMKHGRLPYTLRKAVIRLLQKDGKDNTDILSGKRPISLLTIPIRIIAKCITSALSPYMEAWIGEHQKAYIKGRRIEVNIALLSILLQNSHNVTREDLQFLMVLDVDFKSAFDSVDHDFIKVLLESIGIGKKLAQLIMLIVSTLSATVIVNSDLTDWFKVKRGVPQGCSLSGILFILVLECMFNKAFSEPQVYGKGVSLIKGSVHKIQDTTFADDINLFHTEPEPIQAWWHLFENFEVPSGVTINHTKTAVNLVGRGFFGSAAKLAIGNEMATKIKTLCPGISVNIAQDIKSVGITLSISDYARGLCITGKTWLNRVGKFTSFATALKYKLSSHSLIDKIPKMAVGLARLWYPAMTCPISDTHISNISALMDTILWGKKSPLVKRVIYTQPICEPGGLNVPNPNLRIKSLQMNWATLLAMEQLPACLIEYFRAQIISATGIVIQTVPTISVKDLIAVLATKFNSTAQRKIIYTKCSTEHLYRPLFQAIETMQEIGKPPQWASITTKHIYRALQQNACNVVSIIPGQTKWIDDGVQINWDIMWKVIASLKYHTDFHNAIYLVIVRRIIHPSSLSTTHTYSNCEYCKGNIPKDTTHALFECERVMPIWKHVGLKAFQQINNPPSMNQIFLTLQKVEVTRKGKPKLLFVHLLILSVLSELVRWVKEHLKEQGDTDSSMDVKEFTDSILLKVSERIAKHTAIVEDNINHQDTDVLGIG